MSWWRNSLLVLSVTAIGFAQTGADLESPRVNRVASQLKCSCGCNMDMTCRMEPYMCGVCKQHKLRIYALQQAGKSDREIVDQIVREDGRDILMVRPGPVGSMLSYTGLALGLLLIIWFIKRYRSKPETVEAVNSEMLDRYHDQIEKETSRLE